MDLEALTGINGDVVELRELLWEPIDLIVEGYWYGDTADALRVLAAEYEQRTDEYAEEHADEIEEMAEDEGLDGRGTE